MIQLLKGSIWLMLTAMCHCYWTVFRVTNGTEIDVPTVPRQDENWFFSVVLYIGGGIHLLISLAVVITYFLINGSNFVMPDFFYRM